MSQVLDRQNATVQVDCSCRYRLTQPTAWLPSGGCLNDCVEECVFDRHQATHAINLFDMHQKYADVISLAEATAYLRGWKARHAGSVPAAAKADDVLLAVPAG
jgi:hypothetical protein